MRQSSARRRSKVSRATAAAIRARLRPLADAGVAAHAQRFFKTGPGDYGHGDRFIGIRVPVLRKFAREFRAAPLADVLALLRSPLHEERLVALFILVDQYARGAPAVRERIYNAYLKHVPKHVNNWDLVDASAHLIVGAHVENGDRAVLDELARSPHLWSRRVAIIATFWLIRRGSFDDTLRLAERLLDDEHDLIHKAVGWMLREVGKRSPAVAERFLTRHCRRMPRTMLRYAIERLPEEQRREYMARG
jgi:3-methyladenine DNA glycosylase AlkD